jgi:hypothetical protein
VIPARFHLSILLAYDIDVAEALCDSASGDITHAKKVKKIKRPRRKGTSTTKEAERFCGVKGQHFAENVQQLGVSLRCFSDRVMIRHPEYLLAGMPKKRDQQGDAMNDPEEFLSNPGVDVTISPFLQRVRHLALRFGVGLISLPKVPVEARCFPRALRVPHLQVVDCGWVSVP